MKGKEGGAWNEETHLRLYGRNLNQGLARFIVEHLQPTNILEFGCGLGDMANFIACHTDLDVSFCIEPEVQPTLDRTRNLNLLNIDIFTSPSPAVLNRHFDLVLSIEVAEHIDREKHEDLFDYLVARAGRWIVFSGARPGQGGHGHVAERDEMEWRSEFISRGCTFDPQLTLIARNLSDQKNINHRRNVQVFRAPLRSADLDALERRAQPYLDDLLSIMQQISKGITGNLFYVDLMAARGRMPQISLRGKRENLLQLGRQARDILEIGFAGGHSALIFLLSSLDSKLTIVDPLELPYARPCFDYLSSMFPGRIELIQGYSVDVLHRLPNGAFDLVHLDGGKDKTIDRDLQMIKPLVKKDHVIIIDDTQNAALDEVVNIWLHRKDLEASAFTHMNTRGLGSRWTHKITRYASTDANRQEIIARMQEIYAQSAHKSIYTQRSATGEIPGIHRAHCLIDAMRDVENAGLTGAFVEVGVAAGHSSVIAGLASSRFVARDFYLYDTFQGFLDHLPDELDFKGVSIRDYDLSKYQKDECSLPVVRARILQTGISPERLFLVEGPAEQTVSKIGPENIAILRLDADLFDPTYASLQTFYDRIMPGGYLIIDDYGHWKGCQEAVDAFFTERGIPFTATEIDYTCFMCRI